jgi:hypothetical protein
MCDISSIQKHILTDFSNTLIKNKVERFLLVYNSFVELYTKCDKDINQINLHYFDQCRFIIDALISYINDPQHYKDIDFHIDSIEIKYNDLLNSNIDKIQMTKQDFLDQHKNQYIHIDKDGKYRVLPHALIPSNINDIIDVHTHNSI